MNMIINEETGEITGLTVQNRAEASIAVNENELYELAAKTADMKHEIKSEADYKEYTRAKSGLVSMRIRIKEKGKAARDDANAFSKAVIAEEKRLIEIINPEENRLSAIQEVYDAKKRKIAAAEFAAVEAKNQARKELEASLEHGLNFGDTAPVIKARIAAVSAVELNEVNCETGARLVDFKLKKVHTLEVLNTALKMATEIEAAQTKVDVPNGGNLNVTFPMPIIVDGSSGAAENLLRGTDTKKLNAWAHQLLNVFPPELTTAGANAILTGARNSLSKLVERIEAAADEL
jgi:hypothetical protein